MTRREAYDDGTLAPTSIPVTTNVTDPIPLTPDTRSNRNLRVQLHTHLKIAFECRFRDWVGTRRGGVTLEAVDHGVEVSFFWRLVRCGNRGTVDSFMEDGVIGVVLLHGAEIIRTLEKMGALTAGVLRTDRLAIDALRRETLYED